MREICSYGSVGERGGNEPLYPEMTPEGGRERKAEQEAVPVIKIMDVALQSVV